MAFALAVLLALAAEVPPPADPVPPDPKTRVDELFREYDRSDSPGCAVGVYRHGEPGARRGQLTADRLRHRLDR
jgi:CubicO group peptidase (beta-lactamase class C family)